MRVLFTTVALSGHFFPLVPLAWACRALGHEVLVSAPDSFVDAVRHSGLPVASCGRGADFLGLAGSDWTPSTVAERRRTNGLTFGKLAARSLPGTARLARSWRPDVVVSERAEFAGRVAAADLGVPWVELQWGVAALDEYRLGATAALSEAINQAGLAGLPAPVQVLNPWPPSLRLAHAASHTALRHVSYNGDAHVPNWLLAPRRRPMVCLTLGTVVPHLGSTRAAEAVVPLLADLGKLGVELVVAVDDAVAANWPPLPAAVRHAGRLPLAQVLAGCAVVIHHGGQGTSLTALDTGVPQLVMPVFDDQFDNADAVERAGAGLTLPATADPAAVTAACARLLDSPRFRRRAAGVAAEIAAQPSPAAVAASLPGLAAAAAA